MCISKRRTPRRTGAALVEFAVCLPVLVVLVLSAVECCSMIFLNQSLKIAAYEGIRAAIRTDAEAGEGTARVRQVINERKLQGAQVAFSHRVPETADRGTPITITVSAPCAVNSSIGLRFFSGTLQASAVMIKE